MADSIATGSSFELDQATPRYAAIESLMASAIENGRLPAGTVLTEEPIARLFGTSRTPVRTALGDLLERGLLARFDGRGFVVRGTEGTAPARTPLTREMFGLPEDEPIHPMPVTSERIARDFETKLIHALPFGQFRVNEQGVADHYDVSRTVVRELLSRLQDRGLVQKNRQSHWIIGPLTAREVAHYFAVRGKLEPLALAESAPLLPPREVKAMWQRHEAALAQGPNLEADALEELETDIHIRLLARSRNPHLLRMVHQSQLALVVNRVFASFVGAQPFQVALREHAIILEFIMRGAYPMAAQALEEHLRLSADRTRQRLMAISVFPQPDLPSYLKWREP
ncbi:GntR family transcriptional regulator [Pelagibius sp. Alg239-R121]|uniref:GntR family transcriptional regulator n=1 Tax=Pelagibius sp. Alg239-R121 TaxID=2993448 RepID=UPI0024A6F927|nr:GntR family transcriptional regulator [Pelagibius sp. Alg239-R121]